MDKRQNGTAGRNHISKSVYKTLQENLKAQVLAHKVRESKE